MLIKKQSEEEIKCTDGGKHENKRYKRKKLNNIGNTGGFINI